MGTIGRTVSAEFSYTASEVYGGGGGATDVFTDSSPTMDRNPSPPGSCVEILLEPIALSE